MELQIPKQRLDEALRLRSLLRKDTRTILATKRPRAESVIVWEETKWHVAVAAMVNEVDQVDVDLRQSLDTCQQTALHICVPAYLLALGDGWWSRVDPNVTTELLPLLQLLVVGAIEDLELAYDGFGAMLVTLLLRPALPNGETIEHGGEVLLWTSCDTTLREVAYITARGFRLAVYTCGDVARWRARAGSADRCKR